MFIMNLSEEVDAEKKKKKKERQKGFELSNCTVFCSGLSVILYIRVFSKPQLTRGLGAKL